MTTELGSAVLNSGGQAREMLTVTEPGLYALLARSRKPAARRFDRWVRHEVLPSIRRTGAYGADPLNLDVRLRRMETGITGRMVGLLEQHHGRIDRLERGLERLDQQVRRQRRRRVSDDKPRRCSFAGCQTLHRSLTGRCREHRKADGAVSTQLNLVKP